MAIILHFCDLLMYVQLKSIFKWKETNYVTGWTTHFLTTLGATWIYLSWITHFNITYSDHAHVLVGICTCESLGVPIFLGRFHQVPWGVPSLPIGPFLFKKKASCPIPPCWNVPGMQLRWWPCVSIGFQEDIGSYLLKPRLKLGVFWTQLDTKIGTAKYGLCLEGPTKVIRKVLQQESPRYMHGKLIDLTQNYRNPFASFFVLAPL